MEEQKITNDKKNTPGFSDYLYSAKLYLKDLNEYARGQIENVYLFISSIFFFVLCIFFSSMHYLNIMPGNNISWISWILAMILFTLSFSNKSKRIKSLIQNIRKTDLIIAGFVIILFFISHLINFQNAPWNNFGLFDDAAWDIFFAKIHIFNGSAFQAAFFDSVGYISREVIFHYYISIFFVLFGYNLFVFNIALLFLGFVTVFFTTFLVHRMFKNNFITIIIAITINFLPLHFMHIFMGHRYAIAAPLMILSYYYLFTSFKYNSFTRASVGGIFAALCLGSSVTGKQYIYALVGTVILSVIFNFKNFIKKENIALGISFFISFVIAAAPLLIFIYFNANEYFIRESGLVKEFLALYNAQGYEGIKPYIGYLKEVFISDFSYRRQFLPSFQVIPFYYYILIIPGLIASFWAKRFEVLIISTLPILGSFIAGCYDFRVLIAAPIWIIAMAFSLSLCFKKFERSRYKINILSDISETNWFKYISASLMIVIIFLGLSPSISFIYKTANDPNSLYLLPHRDVAVSRLAQDIVAGVETPSFEMKGNEFNRKSEVSISSYDTLVSLNNSFAIAHLFLQDFDDKKVLSLCNQGTQAMMSPAELVNVNIDAVIKYQFSGKDLKLVWEVSDKSEQAISLFKEYRKYGKDEMFSGQIDGSSFSLYVLTIKSENVDTFKSELSNKI